MFNKNSENNNLKPCPFCGNTDIIVNTAERGDRTRFKWFARVFCADCFADTTNHGFDFTEEEAKQKAVKAWNRRIHPISFEGEDSEIIIAKMAVEDSDIPKSCNEYETIMKALDYYSSHN